ncbi:MAG: T9SS type A sorting domain-containing protein [Ignavibacteria bacterium]|nr:T9SS type A sorting domain-containing protein [Ignavibacteria bacterium]
MIIKLRLITCIAIVFFTSAISAADINGRFVVTYTDSSKLAVLLQINTITGTNALGGATIVIGFDTASINFTSNPIKNTDYIFHNFCSNYYSPATITRPMKGRIWVNIDLPFNNSNLGTYVSDTSGWTDVATIYLNITDPNGSASLQWLSNSPFWGIYADDNITLLEPNFFQNLIYAYDITAPQLVSASLLDSVSLEIEFNEPLDSVSAFNISNYSINNGINILGIHKTTNQNKLIINTTTHTFGQQYTITVNNVSDLSGNLISANHNTAEYTLHPSNVEEEKIPTEFLLSQNYPNPFNPSTKISWQSPVGSHQTVKVYDILGNEVVTLVDEFKPAGSYEVDFSATGGSAPGRNADNLPAGRQGLASGIYIYRFTAGNYTETKKMVLLR